MFLEKQLPDRLKIVAKDHFFKTSASILTFGGGENTLLIRIEVVMLHHLIKLNNWTHLQTIEKSEIL